MFASFVLRNKCLTFAIVDKNPSTVLQKKSLTETEVYMVVYE